MKQCSVSQVVDVVTSAAIEDRLGVTKHAVRAAKTAGIFPAAWYVALCDLCAEAGIDCPAALFSWKAAKNRGADATGPDEPQEDAA